MRTPAGKECKYFYGNYFRGRNSEECRLLKSSGERWSRDLCSTCSVPGILRANACEFMRLRGTVTRPITAILQRRVEISAHCQKVGRAVVDAHLGCGQCHPLPAEFFTKQ